MAVVTRDLLIGLLDYILPGRKEVSGSLPLDSQTIGSVLDFVERREPPNRGDRALLVAYHSVPALHIAVRRIAESVAAEDPILTRDGEPVDEHDALDLLARPNTEMTGHDFRALQQSYLEVLGECFAVVLESSDTSTGLELIPVPPTHVTREATKDGWQWEVRSQGGERWTVPRELMLWRKHFDLRNPFGRGEGLGRVLADEIEIIEYSAEFEKAEFYNHSRPSLAVHLPGTGETGIERFKEKWLSRFRGPNKAGLPLVTGQSKDKLQIEEISRSLKDSQVLELRRASHDLVREAFGIPPLLVGKVEDTNRATAHIEKEVFADNVISPRLNREAQWLQNDVLALFEDTDGISVSHTDPSPQDVERKLEAYEAFPHTVTVNEWRELQGLPPREDGDAYLRPNPAKLDGVPAGDPSGEVIRRSKTDEDGLDGVIIEFPGARQPARTKQNPGIDQIVEAVELETEDTEAREYYREQVEAWAAKEASKLGVGADFDLALLNPKFSEFAEQQGAELVTGIDGTTKDQIRGVVTDAVNEGRSPREIQSDIQRTFDEEITTHRAASIARTEMLKTTSHGQWLTQVESGLVSGREWVATFDGATRAAHITLHGSKVGPREKFTYAGDAAMYPGDFASPGLSINCRCTTVPWIDEMSPSVPGFPEDLKSGACFGVVDEDRYRRALDLSVVEEFARKSGRAVEEEALRYVYWRQFDEALDEIEDEFKSIINDRFRRQQQAVIEAVARVFPAEASA